jgi:enoyl-CoA hydratase
VVGDYPYLRIEVAQHAATIALDRPEAANALSLEVVRSLHRVLDELASEPRVLVITSAHPGLFVSGADIAELAERGTEEALQGINVELFDRLARWRWPTIAAIDGPAVGGGLELALACDFRVATPRSWFRQPELELGILAGAGANHRLVDLVGLARARRMLLLGERVDAEAALGAGLVDALAEDALGRAGELAEKLARRPWRALELTKLALRHASRPSTRDLDVVAQAVLFASEQKRERMTAFLSRRRARRGSDVEAQGES